MKNKITHFLSKMHDHHEAMSKVHRDLAEHHEGLMSKATADDHHYNISSLHKAAQGHHEAMASHCEDMQKAIRQSDAVALPAVDGSVPTNSSAMGSNQLSAAASDEMFKRWFDQQPKVTAVAPSDESLRRTSRLVHRDGKDPRQSMEKTAPKDAVPQLAHFFE